MITLFVCLKCDRETARVGTLEAEGRAWFKTLKKAFTGHDTVQVKSTNCLGGCECSASKGAQNGCCSVGLVGPGRFGYVLNQLEPEKDEGKLKQFVQKYTQRKDGLIQCGDDRELRRHVAARLPATPEV